MALGDEVEGKVTLHKWIPGEPTINVKLIQNTKGFNFEISAQGCSTAAEAKNMIDEAFQALSKTYQSATEAK